MSDEQSSEGFETQLQGLESPLLKSSLGILADRGNRDPAFESFKNHTTGDHSIAGVYFYSIMDCLVELSFAISHDFFFRPQLYQQFDTVEVPFALAALNARYGTEEFFLSKEQRASIYNGLFGVRVAELEDEQGEFCRLRDDLIGACAAFAERVYDTGEDMLRERVRTAHRPFQEYLKGLRGASLKWSHLALTVLAEQISYTILRDKGVAAKFGIAPPPISAWPYVEDSNGDKLVEEITKQFARSESPASKRMPEIVPMTREQISNIQRLALRGSDALVAIIDYDESHDRIADKSDDKRPRTRTAFPLSQDLITKCYTWGAALRALEGPTAGPLYLKRPV